MDDEDRVARLRVTIGEPGGPSGRIEIHLLMALLHRLDRALHQISEEISASESGLGPVELVGLERGSTHLVFEQRARRDYGSVIPLEILAKGAIAVSQGENPPSILTNSGRAVIGEAVSQLAALHVGFSDAPIRLGRPLSEDVETYYEVPLRPRVRAEDVDPLEEEQEKPDEGAMAEGTNSEAPTEAPQWRVNFTGEQVRLDKRQKMSVRYQGRLVEMPLSEETFKAADSDDARWKMVRISALSSAPGPNKIVEVLSIEPATDILPDEVVPMNDAAVDVQPAIERINEFEKLPPGWDSYGAKAISAKATSTARQFLLLVASEARIRRARYQVPFVAPVANGSIQLEWEEGDIGLELEIFADGHIEFLQFAGDDIIENRTDRAGALARVVWFHERIKT